MGYSVEYTPQAVQELKKLDRHIKALIVSWIEKNLVGCENPYIRGKGLSANRSGQWLSHWGLPPDFRNYG